MCFFRVENNKNTNNFVHFFLRNRLNWRYDNIKKRQ
jgi:hypothetical protein